MTILSLNSLEMPLLASAFSSVLPHVICAQPTGRECVTHRGQPNEEADCDSSCRCQKMQTTKKTRGSDMVAKAMMKVHAAH